MWQSVTTVLRFCLNPAMVARRADQFRMNRLDKTFAERAENAEITIDGVKVKEKVEYPNKTWSNAFVYLPYPANDAAKNPNLRR